MEHRGPRTSCTGSTKLSRTQIKEMASQLSHHPQIHNFFSNHVREVVRDGTSLSRFRGGEGVFLFECTGDSLGELGELVMDVHKVARGECREAVALALCALPCGNHFTQLTVQLDIPTNHRLIPYYGLASFLALLGETNTCVLEALTFGNTGVDDWTNNREDWFRRKAEWSLLAHFILHNTSLKTLQLYTGMEKMSEKGGIALADSIRNNRGLQELSIWYTNAFGKAGGGLALAAMVSHNSTLRTLDLRDVPLGSRGTEALAKALLHNTTLKSLQLRGLRGGLRGLEKMSEKGGIALADSIRNNRGLQELWIDSTDAFDKEAGGLALAAMVRHNSTLRLLHLSYVPLCSRGTEALAKALVANRGLRELVFATHGSGTVFFRSAVFCGSAIAGLSDCVLENLDLSVHQRLSWRILTYLCIQQPLMQ